ncbi:hypothetical protein YC2023_026329 [Brassica napus]
MMNLSAIQNLLPPNIAVPSGWKPGMPVELPPAPRALEQQQMRPPPGLHRPPDVIQVRAVQLDILESDNSSDDASSDDEDVSSKVSTIQKILDDASATKLD